MMPKIQRLPIWPSCLVNRTFYSGSRGLCVCLQGGDTFCWTPGRGSPLLHTPGRLKASSLSQAAEGRETSPVSSKGALGSGSLCLSPSWSMSSASRLKPSEPDQQTGAQETGSPAEAGLGAGVGALCQSPEREPQLGGGRVETRPIRSPLRLVAAGAVIPQPP